MRSLSFALLFPCSLFGVPLAPDEAASGVTRVLILAGDVEGRADIFELESLLDDPFTMGQYNHLVSDTNRSITVVTTETSCDLSMGVGAEINLFGPELQLGHHIAKRWYDPLTIVKSTWEGSSLAVDWRPPRSQIPTEFVYQDCDEFGCIPHSKEDFGSRYREMMRTVRDVLQDLENSNKKAELLGFVWFQGTKDLRDAKKMREYGTNLKNLVKDIRKDLDAPLLPVVIGEHGTIVSRRIDVIQRRFSQIQQSAVDDILGPIAFVNTNPYLLKTGARSYDRRFYDRAETMLNVGRALGEAILQLSQSTDIRTRLLRQDSCDDDPFAHIYVDDISRHKRCDWLASNLKDYDYLCDSSDPTGASKLCPGTCDACIDLYADYEMDDNSVGVPEKDTNKEDISTVPRSRQLVACDDDMERRFFVQSTGKAEPCVWLAARSTEQVLFCAVDHPSRARDICPETCGACTDDCDDTTDRFMYEGDSRNCLWLSLRNQVKSEVCTDSASEASTVCPETCQVCDDMEVAASPRTTDVLIAGAGAAGVAAGNILHQNGKNIIIAEASDRIGGRMYTKDMGVEGNTHKVNMGTQYVNGVSGSPYYDLINQTNLTTEEVFYYPFRYYDRDGMLRPEEIEYMIGTASLVQDTTDFISRQVSINCLKPSEGVKLNNFTQAFCDLYLLMTNFTAQDDDDLIVADLWENIYSLEGRPNDTDPSFIVPAQFYYYTVEAAIEPGVASTTNFIIFNADTDFPPNILSRPADKRPFNFLMKFFAAGFLQTSVETEDDIVFSDDRLLMQSKVVEVRWDPNGVEPVSVTLCQTTRVDGADKQTRYPCIEGSLYVIIANEFVPTWSAGVMMKSIELELEGRSFANSHDIAPRFYPSLSTHLPKYADVMTRNSMAQYDMQYFQFNKHFWPEEEVFLSAFSSDKWVGNYAPFWQNFDRAGFQPEYHAGSNLLAHVSVGDRIRDLESKTDAEIIKELLPVLNSMFSQEIMEAYDRAELVPSDVVDFSTQRWGQDPLYRGAWVAALIGITGKDLSIAATKCFGNLCPTGEATCNRYKGFLVGAHFSGERTANHLLRKRYHRFDISDNSICDFDDEFPFNATDFF